MVDELREKIVEIVNHGLRFCDLVTEEETADKIIDLMPHWISVTCQHCGGQFEKRQADINRTPKNFCSKQCSGNFRKEQNNKRLFEKAIEVESGCWEWQGSKNSTNYGTVRYNGKSITAHRASYIHAFGDIPKGMHVLHKCDNPPCINPKHLFLGTHTDNMQDMIKKGRRVKRGPLPQPPKGKP